MGGGVVGAGVDGGRSGSKPPAGHCIPRELNTSSKKKVKNTIRSGNDLLPDATKPLTEPILTISKVLWHSYQLGISCGFRSTPAPINTGPQHYGPQHRPINTTATTPAPNHTGPLPYRSAGCCQEYLATRLWVWQVFERCNAGHFWNQYVIHLYASVTS